MALVTAAMARAQIPALAGTTDDSLLTSLIAAVESSYARLCGYPGAAPSMQARTYRMLLGSDGGRELDLQVYPVCSVSLVEQDDTGDYVTPDSVDSDDYAVRDGRAVRMLSTASSSWASADDGNRVTFVAGYGGATQLDGAVSSASATTITVDSAANLSVGDDGLGRVLIDSEVVAYTGKTSTTLTGCIRGADGTTAATHLDNATVTAVVPDALEQLIVAGTKWLYERRAATGVVSMSPRGGGSVSTGDGARASGEIKEWPDHILAALGAFALPRSVLG